MKKENRKPFIDGYRLSDGRVLNLMAEGRLVNIAAGNGHPADILDLSFGIQLLSVLYMAKNGKQLKPAVHNIPQDIDNEVARTKLEAMGIAIDVLSAEQLEYMGSM